MSQQGRLRDISDDFQTLTGNSGGAVSPDGAGTINVIGTAGTTVTGNPGTNTLTIDASGSVVATTYEANQGTATATGNILKILGGTGLNTGGATNVITVNLEIPVSVANGGTGTTSLTDHGVLIGSGTSAITPLAVGTTGELLVATTGADPTFAPTANGNFTFSSSTSAATRTLGVLNNDNTSITSHARLNVTTGGGSGGDPYVRFIVTGGEDYSFGIDNTDGDTLKITDGNTPSSGNTLFQITSAGVPSFPTSPLTVPSGGTGAITLTDGGIVLGSGTGAVTITAQPTDGQLLIGSTSADPVLALLASADASITITNGAGSIDLAVASSGFAWEEVTDASVSMAVNTGYLTNRGTLVTATLPTTAAVGDVVRVAGSGSGGWFIAQNADEIIHFLGTDTTTGVGGSLASTVRYDAVELVCNVANTEWVVISSMGNITIV